MIVGGSSSLSSDSAISEALRSCCVDLGVQIRTEAQVQVAEADTTRYKQTGTHVIVDGGGKPDTAGLGAGLWSSKYATGESSDRVEIPGAYSYGVQGFISQRSRVDWGRTPYASGENGGIAGYVVYSSSS